MVDEFHIILQVMLEGNGGKYPGEKIERDCVFYAQSNTQNIVRPSKLLDLEPKLLLTMAAN